MNKSNSPGCPRPSLALPVQHRGLKHHSFDLHKLWPSFNPFQPSIHPFQNHSFTVQPPKYHPCIAPLPSVIVPRILTAPPFPFAPYCIPSRCQHYPDLGASGSLAVPALWEFEHGLPFSEFKLAEPPLPAFEFKSHNVHTRDFFLILVFCSRKPCKYSNDRSACVSSG